VTLAPAVVLAALLCIPVLSAPARAQQPEAPAAAGKPAAAQQPPDVPSGPGSLTGRVLRPSGEALPGVDVVLYALSQQGPGLRRTHSDAAGRYHFDRLSTDPAVGWLLGARYQGVPFPGGRVRFDKGQLALEQDVTVTDLTLNARRIHVSEVTLQLSRGGPGGSLRVAETLHLRNDGKQTFYVRQSQRHGLPAVRAELPRGAQHFEMPLGVIPEGFERDGARLRYWGPVYPGNQELSYSYVVPTGDDPLSVVWQPRLPSGAERVTVLLPEGLGAWTGKGWKDEAPRDVQGRHVRVLAQTHVPPGAALSAGLRLPPTRQDPTALSLSEVRLVLEVDDAAMHVQETHTLKVSGDTPILGTASSPLLQVSLPAGAANLRFGSDAAGVQLIPAQGGGLTAVGITAPGDLHVEMDYRLPVAKPPARLVRSFRRRVPLLSVFLADTGRLVPHAELLHRRRPVATQDQTYMHLEAFDVKPGEPVALEVGLRPPRSAPSPTLVRGASAALALGVIGLLVAPLRHHGAMLAEPAIEPASRRERESLYTAIRDLDHDHETGKVSDEDHAALRGELRARAVALLREERQAERARAATSAAPAVLPGGGPPGPGGLHCAACGEPVEPGHRFCPQCGAPQAERPGTEARG